MSSTKRKSNAVNASTSPPDDESVCVLSVDFDFPNQFHHSESQASTALQNQRPKRRGTERTCSMTTRGVPPPLSVKVLSDDRLTDFKKTLQVGCHVHLDVLSGDNQCEKIEGVVHLIDSDGFVVSAGDRKIHIPLQVTGVLRVSTAGVFDLPPFTWNSRCLTSAPDWVVYYDGSVAKNPGPGAAAVVVWSAKHAAKWEASTYHPFTTSTTVEHVAQVAAMKLASQLPGSVAIIGDSEVVQQQLLGRMKVTKQHLAQYVRLSQQIWCSMSQERVSLHHMLRESGNHADRLARSAVARGCGVNNQSQQYTIVGTGVAVEVPLRLFPEIVTSPGRPTVRSLQDKGGDVDAVHVMDTSVVETFDDYVALRRFPARSDVPVELRGHWAALVKAGLVAIVEAVDVEVLNASVLKFLALPHVWLPKSSSKTRIALRFARDEPFRMDLRLQKISLEKPDRITRISRVVTSLAKDHNLRSAVKVLEAEADVSSPVAFNVKAAALEAKFMPALAQPLRNLLPDRQLPLPSAVVLRKVLRKMKRYSASAVDSWSKGLLVAAVDEDETILDLVAQFVRLLLRGQLPSLAMRCLRAARAVGIPKTDGGVRPICVSNFWLKLAGGVALAVSCCSPAPFQHAVGVRDGAQKVVHEARAAYRRGLTLVKFDTKNAFNTMRRCHIEAVLHYLSSTANDPLMLAAYFRTVYGSPSDAIAYGSGGHHNIVCGDGVRQGDATSALLFCLAFDHIIQSAIDEFVIDHGAAALPHVWSFMDDLTFALPSSKLAVALTRIVKRKFFDFGLQVSSSSDKSAVLAPPCDNIWSSRELQEALGTLEMTLFGDSQEFKLLGSVLSGEATEFIKSYFLKMQAFFRLIGTVPLHPAIIFTLLRLCGSPRLVFVCSTMEPRWTQNLAATFDTYCRLVLGLPEMLGMEIKEDSHLLYERAGAGLPRYSRLAAELYEHAFARFVRQTSDLKQVALVQTTPSLSVPLRCQVGCNAGAWLFYDDQHDGISPADFVGALAIRLRLNVERVSFPAVCNCAAVSTTFDEFVHHVLACDCATKYTHLRRHDDVKAALLHVVRKFGILAIDEPSFYVYDDLSAKRPDITFRTQPRLVTDITIVTPSVEVDVAASKAAADKRAYHSKAVQEAGHVFIPFALEVHGHMHKSCLELLDKLGLDLQPNKRTFFKREAISAVQVALARARAAAIRSAAAMQRSLR